MASQESQLVPLLGASGHGSLVHRRLSLAVQPEASALSPVGSPSTARPSGVAGRLAAQQGNAADCPALTGLQ